jgi:hypothetical protein
MVAFFQTGPNIPLSILFTNSISLCLSLTVFFYGAKSPSGPGPPHYRGFTINLRHNTLSLTPMDLWSSRCRDLYLTTHNNHQRQTSVALAGFKPTTMASQQPQTCLRQPSHWDQLPSMLQNKFLLTQNKRPNYNFVFKILHMDLPNTC